jgi:uncharacterized protein YvpB
MKVLHFLTALLPLLGCSHTESNDIAYKSDLNKNKQIQFEQVNQLTPKTTTNFVEKPLAAHNTSVSTLPEQKMLDVPLIKQNPELRYGCEVTSLAMVLNHAGVKVTKMELYQRIKKDDDPIQRSASGDILKWGNPNDGFVGDMTGRRAGYAVFDQPIAQLVNDYLPDRAVNLTNEPFEKILFHVSKGYPIVVWTTGDYRLPDRPESWKHGNQMIKSPLDLHAVVLVGYDKDNVYLNDPLSGKKKVKVNKQRFIASWQALKSRAVSYE